MALNVLVSLAVELERVLPMVKALAEVETKGAAAQKLLADTQSAQARANQEASEARRSADQTIADCRAEIEEKTASFKAELVERHAKMSEEYHACCAQSKQARQREEEQIRAHKIVMADMASAKELAQTELTELTERLELARAKFAKALAGV